MAEDRQRLDKWLFFARIFKSRSLSSKFVQAGKVRVNGEKTDNPAKAIRPEDVLTITLERRVLVLKIVDTGTRRGPYEEARLLYEDMMPHEPEKKPEVSALPVPMREPGQGRPTKKDRRKITKLMRGTD